MARSGPRKRRRLCRAGGEGHDYLSGLTDDILLDIASRLATRHAASLSLLSRRFRGLLAQFARVDSVTVLDPTLPLPSYPGRPVLLRRLVFEPNNGFSLAAFRRLLDAATDRGISELSIRLPRSTYLPRNVLSIPTLAVLSLDTCALPRWCPPACAHLRTLKLHRVNIPRRMITAIFKAVPMLATLEMVYCTGFVGSCRVESSAVRNLLFMSALEQREITLKLAGLTTVTLRTRSKVKMVKIQPAPKIRRAYLHIARPRTKLKSRIRPFLDAGTGLTCLTLRGVAVMLLSSEYKQTPKLAVTFEDLWILSLSLDFSNESQLCFLLKLLESCPNLQKLSLSSLEEREDAALPKFSYHEEKLSQISCLTESLVQVKFLGFRPQHYQKKLLIFLLTHVPNLRKMGVEFPENQEAAVRRILSVRRALIERATSKYNQCCWEFEYPSR